ncbi:MbnP family protein [Sphingobacterium sp. JB170]|uniref:MbnP family protein n=1 Tax=Sphingobacterium sp. JB170 TaxID=1434842 RepID=UPI00097F3A41|nr:MbnP family protein [Sphingobacterium sp. JB170]SJN16747.1 hypothetical protein FM107_00650 [Sphingobacterium sp. JB170]
MSHNYIVHLNKLIIYNRQYDQKEFFSIASLAMVASCSKDTGLVEVVGGDLSIAFDNVVGNENFALDKAFDIDGKIYRFNSFRYWGVSNIRLQKQNGEWIEIPNSYYLIEETKDILIQDGAYTSPARKRGQINLQKLPIRKFENPFDPVNDVVDR